MTARHREVAKVVTVTVESTSDVWTNETDERVFVDEVELVLEGDDKPVVVAKMGRFVEPGETVRLELKVT